MLAARGFAPITGKEPMPLHGNDLSAVRAFILLRQESPDGYAAIPQAAWEKWAPVIVGLRLRITDDSASEAGQLVRVAFAKAPAASISAVRTMLHMEKARARTSLDPQALSVAHPFQLLNDLEACQNEEGLNAALFEEMQDSDLRPAEYAALMDALLKAGYEPAIEDAVARIDRLDESTIVIADVLLRRAPAAVWRLLWPKLLANDELARAVLTRAAGSFYHSTAFYVGIGADAIADLYLLMVRLFPPGSDPGPASGFVSPLQMVTSLRDGAVRCLAAMGTEEAVRALMRLVAERPDIPLLPFELSRSELEMRLKTWSPLNTKEIFVLTDHPGTRLITSADDLLDVLAEALGKFAAELHGAQTPVRDLWDRQGSTQFYRPIDENGLSDLITRYLRQGLKGKGIFANREVEVTRRPGAPVGQRTDILVNTVRHGADGQPFDPLSAVIEVKGCWNRDLFTALDAQLIRDYMVDLRAPVGIYLVGWFDNAQWDNTDYRLGQVPKATITEVQVQLDQQAAAAPDGFRVRAVVLAIRAPGT